MIEKYLYQPYPVLINKWKIIIPASAFVAIFILIFQPFGLSEYHSIYKTIVLLGYGGVTFLALFLNLFALSYLFKNWFDETKWTVLKQMIWLTWIIFTIGLGNYFYASIIFSNFWELKVFIIFQLSTMVVGIIPIVVLTIVNQNIKLSYYLKEANDFNNKINAKKHHLDNEQIIHVIADNEKDKFEIELSNLLYIESVGNYVRVHYFKEGKIKNSILRSALKRVELQLKECKTLIKCHRAFLVNFNQIEKVKGNSQGLKIVLKNTDTEIPVSRNYSKDLKDKINYN